MKSTLLTIFITLLFLSEGKAQLQSFTDTIYTAKLDTIVCEIILVGDDKLLYKINPKRKKVEYANIPVSEAIYKKR